MSSCLLDQSFYILKDKIVQNKVALKVEQNNARNNAH